MAFSRGLRVTAALFELDNELEFPVYIEGDKVEIVGRVMALQFASQGAAVIGEWPRSGIEKLPSRPGGHVMIDRIIGGGCHNGVGDR